MSDTQMPFYTVLADWLVCLSLLPSSSLSVSLPIPLPHPTGYVALPNSTVILGNWSLTRQLPLKTELPLE